MRTFPSTTNACRAEMLVDGVRLSLPQGKPSRITGSPGGVCCVAWWLVAIVMIASQGLGCATITRGPANFLVAAADSSPRVKARADYVCDGSDDHIEIQAAIDSLSDPSGQSSGVSGGVVELSPGVFHLGATIRCHDGVVNLIGAGMGSTELILEDGVNEDIVVVGTGTKQGLHSGRIAHLSLNGRGEAQTKGSGIRVLAGLRLTIEDVRVYQCKENGVYLQGLSGAVRNATG